MNLVLTRNKKRHLAPKLDKVAAIRSTVVGVDCKVPLLNGNATTYINFDNAASTPPLASALRAVNNFMPWYSSVHRGSGFKSLLATKAYDDARQTVGDFFGADDRDHVVIFGKNTTEAINKLAYRLPLDKDDVVLVSLLEHHSNDLPWRPRAKVKHVKVNELGHLDETDFDRLLKAHKGKIKLIAICGGSNVTGHMPDIYGLAKKAHAAGAQIFVDCAQLAPHRRVELKPLDDPAHLDYIAISAHKMYAPFGTGALIGRRDTFERGEPDYRGGGTIDVVTTKEVEWAAPPDCDEAGSPNVVGAVALAASLNALGSIGMKTIAAHEAQLTAYALERLPKIKGLKLYGDINPGTAAKRLGVIPFNITGVPHGLVAAVLGTEWGIGVRSGCFCAHPYVTHLLDVPDVEFQKFRHDVSRGDRRTMPGFVRLSFGLYNTTDEIDRLVEALNHITAGQYRGKYKQEVKSGDFIAEGWEPQTANYFSL